MKRIVLLVAGLFLTGFGAFAQKQYVMTVTGAIDSKNLGFTLHHEHVMSNFGSEPELKAQYDEKALMAQVVPYLQKLRSLGVNSIFDGTTSYFGRNVTLLKRISKKSGIQIITNTGFYAAANDRYVPDWAHGATIQEIADFWIAEFEKGIDGTEIKPGYIKLAFDDGEPSEIDLKLFEAGIRTHLKTGLTLAVHTGDHPDAVQRQLHLLKKYGVSADAWVWIHANSSKNNELLLKTAALGAWISLDGANPSNVDDYVKRITLFKKQKLLHKVLLSHDGNSFPTGGAIREYQTIPEILVPKLKELGFTKTEINQLVRENPRNAFSLKK